MRHQQLADKDSYNKVDIAAVWSVSPQVAPLPVPDLDLQAAREPMAPTPAAPDVPAAVGKIIVGVYVGLLAAFALATAGSGHSIFMIVIAAIFLAAFFTVPYVFLGVEPKSGRRPLLGRFLEDGMDTLTGHSSGSAALVQMLIVPVFLTLGVIAMGIAAAFIF
jgi:hypothetical protein